MDSEHTRRRVLELAGLGTGLALAGCVGGRSSAERPTDTPAPETESQTETETETETPEPKPKMSTVFHFTKGEEHQDHALANVTNLLADDTVDLGQVVLVVNGKGLQLVLKDRTTQAEKVSEVLETGVAIRACSNTIERYGVTEDDLIDGVEVVPSGVGELTKLQAGEGYAYIKTP